MLFAVFIVMIPTAAIGTISFVNVTLTIPCFGTKFAIMLFASAKCTICFCHMSLYEDSNSAQDVTSVPLFPISYRGNFPAPFVKPSVFRTASGISFTKFLFIRYSCQQKTQFPFFELLCLILP